MQTALRSISVADRVNDCERYLREVDEKIQLSAEAGEYHTYFECPKKVSKYIRSVLTGNEYKLTIKPAGDFDAEMIRISWDRK